MKIRTHLWGQEGQYAGGDQQGCPAAPSEAGGVLGQEAEAAGVLARPLEGHVPTPPDGGGSGRQGPLAVLSWVERERG